MEEGKKKQVMIGVIVVCVVLVIAINVIPRIGESSGRGVEKEVWLRCANEECETEYKIDTAEYNTFMNENRPPMVMPNQRLNLPMPCQECSEESAYKAYRCDKCNITYFPGDAGGKYVDECPECGATLATAGRWLKRACRCW